MGQVQRYLDQLMDRANDLRPEQKEEDNQEEAGLQADTAFSYQGPRLCVSNLKPAVALSESPSPRINNFFGQEPSASQSGNAEEAGSLQEV